MITRKKPPRTARRQLGGAILAGWLMLPAAGGGAPPAAAQSVVSTGQSYVSGHLVPGAAAWEGRRLAGLSLTIAPGWKTFWRAPGEAGVPPRFDWAGSENLDSIEVLWPRPEVFDSFGMQTIGYGGTVMLPLRLVPHRADRPVTLDIALELGVCRDICLFEHVRLRAVWPAKAVGGVDEIEAAMALVPREGAEAGLRAATCRIAGTGSERALGASLTFDHPLRDPVVTVESVSGEGPGSLWVHSVESRAEGERLSVDATVALEDAQGWIERGALRFTVIEPDWAADIRGCTAPEG